MNLEQILADNHNFWYYLFHLTAGGLAGLAAITGLSYQFWNIAIWFGILPASGIYLVSRKTSPWINLVSAALLLYLLTVDFNSWFDSSVAFLNDMVARFGTDYRIMSVIVCLVIPYVAFGILIYATWRSRFKAFLLVSALFLAIILLLWPISNSVMEGTIRNARLNS